MSDIVSLEKAWQDACAAKRALFEKGVKKDSPEYQASRNKVNAAWAELQEARGVSKKPEPADAPAK